MSEQQEHVHSEPPRLTVKEAIHQLQHVEDQDAVLAICAHGFEGMENQAWFVTHLALVKPDEGQSLVLVEGAGDPNLTSEA